jgi:hypothetical protein
MKRRKSGIPLMLFALASLVALPLAAELYTVTLTNGNTFESRYRPREAAWNPNGILLLTDVGNWIVLDVRDIASVTSKTEAEGRGTVLDQHTILLGWAPNDAPDPADEADLAPAERLLSFLQQQAAERPVYNNEQFVEPEALGGIPVWMTGTTTPPMGAGQQP